MGIFNRNYLFVKYSNKNSGIFLDFEIFASKNLSPGDFGISGNRFGIFDRGTKNGYIFSRLRFLFLIAFY